MYCRYLAVFGLALCPITSNAAPYETEVLMNYRGWVIERGIDLADGALICRALTQTSDGRVFEMIHHENGAGYITISDEAWQLASRTIAVSLVTNQTEWQFYALAEGSKIEMQLAPPQVFDFKSDLVWGSNITLRNAAGERISSFATSNAKSAIWEFGTCLPRRSTVRPTDPDPFD